MVHDLKATEEKNRNSQENIKKIKHTVGFKFPFGQKCVFLCVPIVE